jgi:hypothetical protein
VEILKILGKFRAWSHQTQEPGVEEVAAMIEWLSHTIHEWTGTPYVDILLTISRMAEGQTLEGWPEGSPLAEYTGETRPDLSHVAVALRGLDRDGGTARLWRRLYRRWPIIRTLYRGALSGVGRATSDAATDTETPPRIQQPPALSVDAPPTVEPPSPPTPATVEVMQHGEWTKKGPLGLTINTNTHTVDRNDQHIEFEENGWPWEVFMKLVDRHPGRYLVKDLGRDVWNPDGSDVDPEDNQVQQAISAIRKLLQPLGITVNHTRKLGYVLADLDPPASAAKGNNGRKRRSRRARQQ